MPDTHLVTVETTAGDLVLELDAEHAPVTVENFLHHVRSGYYAGVVFHRILPRFVAQSGGYTADGTRKPNLRPPIPVERTGLKHTDGALGMARLPDVATSATSEFYICDGPQRALDQDYCVFGRLVKGRDAFDRILRTPTRSDNWPRDPTFIVRAYEGEPDAANPTPKFTVPGRAAAAAPEDADAVRKAAKRLRGRAAILKARRGLTGMSEVDAAVAEADRTGERAALERAEKLLEAREARK